MKIAVAACALAMTLTAGAAEHRTMSPVAIYGQWLGAPGAPPTDCKGDGYLIAFGSVDGKKFLMTVQHRVNGIAPLNGKQTEYTASPMPPTVPAYIDIYLTGAAGELGVKVRNGSQLELYPPGADKTFPAPSLVLQRC